MSTWAAHPRARSRSVTLLMAVCGCVPACTGPADASREPGGSAPAQASERGVLRPSVVEIDLGLVNHGRTRLEAIRLHNTSDEPVEIVRTHSTCECLTIGYSDRTVAARESVLLTVHFVADPYQRFVGGLGMTVTGYGADDQPLFELPVVAEVLASEERVPIDGPAVFANVQP